MSRFRGSSAGESLLFAHVASPWGDVRVVEGQRGVLCVQLRPTSESALAARLERSLGASVELLEVDRLPSGAELAAYFRGRRREFRTRLDFRMVAGFGRRVLERLSRVPFGTTISYGKLATLAGSPGAARAVGGAMRTNPLPIFVPCHRVIAADGSLGGFTGGVGIKRCLLELESIDV